MRQILNPQIQIGEIDISAINFDLQSRDDIPQILRGLQHIYTTPEIREPVFECLQALVPEEVDTEMGRPGMELWDIFVLGTIRLNLNCDYDRVMELANQHRTLRQMLGHGLLNEEAVYRLQTIKDNVRLITPEILDDINQIVVKAGHQVLGIEDAPLNGRCDSSVVETNVHYPTDINLLTDAMRKIIRGCGQIYKVYEIGEWRQYEYNFKSIKNLYQRAQKMKSSSSKDEEKRQAQQARIEQAHEALIERSQLYIDRAKETLEQLPAWEQFTRNEIEYYIEHAERQIDQIERRVIKGEKIPHDEKCFSIFQEHTEWISKGKAGVPVELGLRVSILEDQVGFLLHHRVMEEQTDDKVAVEIVKEAQERFPTLRLCSFDKGFYSPQNREELNRILEKVVLPKKGKWSKKDREIETEEEFVSSRKQHSAVESAINALEVHGLDRCPDHGIEGFRRYVAMAVVARNIQKLGAILLNLDKKAAQRKKRRLKQAA